MPSKIYFILIILIVSMASCKNSTSESKMKSPEINERQSDKNQETKNVLSEVTKNKIIDNLQGKWKEPDYPFRKAEFINTTVEFIEEGLIEEPRFKEFKISNQCPFDTTNIKNTKPGDIILTIMEDERCEKLKISNDTLIIIGFSITTNSMYNIVYEKVSRIE